ncbi:MAG TPA: hypothetical protein VEK57_12240 [Thermoanaerobaculia bacterium]|nr:hypothetical protein [Thermoanaerobaculia bacterium]
MTETERAIAIKDEYSERILAHPGVVGIGYGWRTRAGVHTDEPVIRIYVLRKMPIEALSLDERLPTQIEGIPTDVNESGFLRLQADGDVPDGRWIRPLRAGVKIDMHESGRSGSLGCFAWTEEETPRAVMITAQHVLYSNRKETRAARGGPPVGQPYLCSRCSKCCTTSNEIGDVWFAQQNETADIGVVELRAGVQWYAEVENAPDPPIPIVGVETFQGGLEALEKADKKYGKFVFKRGWRTGKQGGLLVDISANMPLKSPTTAEVWEMTHLLKFAAPENAVEWTASGDSGGIVYMNSQKIAGIYIGVDNEDFPKFGYACPIGEIQKQFTTQFKFGLKIDTTQFGTKERTAPAVAKQALPKNAPAFAALQRAQDEIRATRRGRELEEVIHRHEHEALGLVRTNRRVAAVWHRNHGPRIVQHALQSVADPKAKLPESFDGRTLDECAHRIADVFRRYGSPELVRAVDRNEADVRRMGGITYRDFLTWLEPIG